MVEEQVFVCKQKTAYEIRLSLVGSEMCIRGRDELVQCLEEFDPGVKESAAWALGYIAGHNACPSYTSDAADDFTCVHSETAPNTKKKKATATPRITSHQPSTLTPKEYSHHSLIFQTT